MTAPLNKIPNGLLSFLGIKNGGRNPEQLGALLAPTWDLAQWYMATTYEYGVANANIAAAGLIQFGPANINDGDTWFVHAGGVAVDCTAGGASIAHNLGISDSSGNFVPLIDIEYSAPTTWNGRSYPRGFLLGPGEVLAQNVAGIAGAPLNAFYQWKVTRFRV